MDIKKHTKLWFRYFYIRLKELHEYKFNALLLVAGFFVQIAIWIFFWKILLNNQPTFHGWELGELILLPIFMEFAWAFQSLTSMGLLDIDYLIMEGHLDRLLARPINTLFGVMAEHMNIWDLFTRFFTGIILLAILIPVFDLNPTPLSILSSIIIGLIGVALVSFTFSILFITAFWIGKSQFFYNILNSFYEFSEYPLTIFPSAIQMFFTFLFPLMFITVWPVKAFIGDLTLIQTLGLISGGLILATFWGAIFMFVWKKGIKRYESGGG